MSDQPADPDLGEHLTKMARIAQGALTAIGRESFEATTKPLYTDTERRMNYWNGYRQAIDEIEHFIGEDS